MARDSTDDAGPFSPVGYLDLLVVRTVIVRLCDAVEHALNVLVSQRWPVACVAIAEAGRQRKLAPMARRVRREAAPIDTSADRPPRRPHLAVDIHVAESAGTPIEPYAFCLWSLIRKGLARL